MRNCKKHGFDIGDERIGGDVGLSGKYLRESGNILTEFGILLVFVMWRKTKVDSDEDIYSNLSDLSYNLIRRNRSDVAAHILEFALFSQTYSVPDILEKMMIVNFSNALKKLGHEERSKEIREGLDWTAASDKFRISIASLNDDVDMFVSLMERVAKNQDLSKDDFREWPVFDWVRDDRRVQDKFQELYGEPMVRPKEPDATETNDAAEPASGNGTTVH